MSLLVKMRKGDKDALRRLLEQEGQALDTLMVVLNATDIEAVGVALWKASVLPPVETERGFVLTVALASFAKTLPPPSATVPEVEPRDLALQVGRVRFGGDPLDQQILTDTLAAHPEAKSWAEQFSAALDKAEKAPAGPSRRLSWPELLQRLS